VSEIDGFGLDDLARRRSAKWDVERGIALGVAEMDFPLAPAIRRALADLVERSDVGYPTARLAEAVRESFAARWRDRHSAALEPGRVVVTTDVVNAIYCTLATCSDPGAGVLVLTPAYPPFFSAVAETGRRLVAVDLAATAEGYRLDLDRLAAAAEEHSGGVLLLCNPHNPTGRVFDRRELESLAELACRHDLLVISDEIHADLVLDGRHLPISAIGPEVAARTVTLGSASKSFNLAGLRCALAAFGSEDVLSAFSSVPAAQRGSVSLPGLVATLAAFEEGDAWLSDVLAYLHANRDLVATTLGAELPDARFLPPQGTYLAWLDLRGTGLGDDPAATLAGSGITLAPGPHFGEAGRGFARLNFATTRPVLAEALRRLVAGCGA
jgi:cystathionine beta-lyase